MFELETTKLKDSLLITLPAFKDDRGIFVKNFQDSVWKNAGIDFELRESYFSVSHKDVIRGMHFQLPPYQHAKIVFCPQGSIMDVIIDLRKNSETFGQFISVELSGENHKALYIPAGFAHGFRSLENDSLTYYLVSSEYNKESDTGILFNSFGMEWGVARPVISERDLSFSRLQDWNSVF